MGRLDAELSRAGLGSRREVRELVRTGRVTVDGKRIRIPEYPVKPAEQEVMVDGQPIRAAGHQHLLMHKPAGVVTAARDPRHGTVLDLVPQSLRGRDLQPVGRLDKDTTGALLFTTDGELAHRLLAPKRHVVKVYRVALARPLLDGAVDQLAAGLVLGDGTRCLPAVLRAGPSLEVVWLDVQEGKYHLVKRMVAALGSEVVGLHRERFGPVTLPTDLNVGAMRPLTQPEVAELYAAAGLVPEPPSGG